MYGIKEIRRVLDQEQTVKQCSKCKKVFPATTDHFYRNKKSKDGLQGHCKKCQKKRMREYLQTAEGKEANRKSTKKWLENNKVKVKEYHKKYYKEHAKKIHQYSEEYRKKHPETFKAGRKRLIKEALFNYVLKRYFEHKKGAIIRYEFLYNFLLDIAKKFHLNYSKDYVTRLLKRDKKLTLPFLKGGKGMRVKQKKILGLKLKNKKGKMIEVSNLGNLSLSNINTKTNTLTSKDVCVLISCVPGQNKLEEIYTTLDQDLKSHINYPNAITYYKKIESFLYCKNLYRSTSVKIATAVYLASDLSQKVCSDICGVSAMSFRKLLKEVLKLSTEQIEKIRKANTEEDKDDES